VTRIVADAATGGEVLYRLLRATAPVVDDFRGRRDLPRGRPVPADTPWLLLAGVSMFDTQVGALRVARQRPATLARVRLAPRRGVHLAATGARGHRTVWGAPSILLECVEQVADHA
jgi:hypothetical protein